MCGISGAYGIEDKKLIRSMNSKISHRGPDQEGYFFDKDIMLGHRRLSIIDLSERGRQPMHNEDETVWVVFNGEIYNFLDIKDELEKKGHRFYSETDTEVIVHAYEEYGTECLKHFNGMFAFALWDANKKQLFLARDRLGVKPLHYYKDDKKFLFASEIKAILEDPTVPRKVNTDALSQFIAFEYVPAPLTMFQGIYKLPAGHYALLQNNQLIIKQYWNAPPGEFKKDEQTMIEETRKLLADSIQKRMISDVPLGAFLSGGIDSSTVVAMMSKHSDQPIKTFSIGFTEQSYNESSDARLVAETFRTDHHEKIVAPESIIPIFDKLIPQIDEPFGDLSIFPTYLVSKFARTKVTVSLSGDGGDELFGGYDWYVAQSLAKAYKYFPGKIFLHPLIHKLPQTEKSKGIVNKAKRFVEGYEKEEKYSHLRWMSNITVNDIKTLLSYSIFKDPFSPLEKYGRETNSLNDNMYLDVKTYLPDDILTKVDRASMLVSLEAREPLLDYRLVEYALRIPAQYKIHGTTRKYILKKAMQGTLPQQILKKEKQGFTLPMKHWMRNELKDWVVTTLSEENLKETGFFNQEYVDRIVHQHFTKRKDNQRHIWSMLSFVLWHKKYIQKK